MILLKRVRTCCKCWYIWFSFLKDFVALEAEVHNLGIAKLFNVPTNLNNLKTGVDDIALGKLKTVPIDLKKIKWCGRSEKLLTTQNSRH